MAPKSKVRDDTLQATINDLIGTLKPAGDATDALNQAKADAALSSDTSIRAFVKRASAINVALTDEEIDEVAEAVATGAYSGSSVKVRKSEIGTLLRGRKHLPKILTGIDKVATDLKAHDAKARPLNVRQQVISAARKMRDPDTTVDEVMAELRTKVLKKAPTSSEKARAMVEKLRSEAAYRVKVGDETMLDEAADHALTVLEDLLDGKRPDDPTDELTEEIDELKTRISELEAQLAEAASNPTTPAEPLEATQDGDEPPAPSDTPETETPAPEPAQPAGEGTKRRSTGSSITGYDIDDLLDMTKKRP